MGWIAPLGVGARHATITQPEPPPPPPPGGGGGGTPAFGPRPDLGDIALSTRVTAVRNGTIPQAVTHPGGSPTVVNPGDNIATKITTAGTGGTLWFTKGTHNVTAPLNPLAGQDWICESIAGYTRSPTDSAVFDGGNGALNALVMSSNLNVTIKGGVWQNQGNASSATFAAAIFHNGGATKGGWLVQDAIINDNFNIGLKFSAPNCIGRRCYLTNNGRYGPNATNNAAGEDYTGIVFENCRWSFNNSRELETGAAAGGSKFVHAPGLIVRHCWIHDNKGFGVWPDFAVVPEIGDVTVTENVIEGNHRSGVFLEAVGGGCSVTRNYIVNNGAAITYGVNAPADTNCSQIMITEADSTKGSGVRGLVSRNVLDYTGTQSTQLGRLFVIWSHGIHPNRCRNWDITINQFVLRNTTIDERVGGRDTASVGNELWSSGINFIDNEYRVASTSNEYWEWDVAGGTGVLKNYTQWKAFHPGDDLALVLI